MTRFLFAWEMGANYGHANKIAPVAQALGPDADVTVAAREVLALRAIAPDLRMRLLPAPYSPTRRAQKGEHSGQSFPGVLRTEGWDSGTKLAPLIEAWRNLFDLVQPDILVTQAAPTALLAARGLGIKTALLGSGYDAPPRAYPMPCFTPENPQSVEIAHQQEADSTAIANDALRRFGAPELTHFRDLLDVEDTLLMAYPECDHFAPRARIEPDHTPYLGQLLTVDAGHNYDWKGNAGPRILAYVRPGLPPYDATVRALAQLGPTSDIILAAPGIDPAQAKVLEREGLQVCDGPVRLDRVLPDCDLGISHGTNGIGAAFIAFGVPQLGVPTHREQMLFSQAVARAGMGLGIAGKFGGPQVVEAIQRCLNTPDLTSNAKAARKRIIAQGLDRPAEKAAERLWALNAR